MNYTLTSLQAKNAKSSIQGKATKLWDGGGLHLFVSPNGAKSWRYKYRLGGKEHLFSIGMFPEVTLAAARDIHAKAHLLVRSGIHPKARRDADQLSTTLASGNTFRAIAEQWISKKQSGWSPSYCNQLQTTLTNEVFPRIGSLPIKSVNSQHILSILVDVDGRGAPVVAINIRQWCSKIFQYAVAHLQAELDPTAVLKGAIKRPKVKHNLALKPDQITALLGKLRKFQGHRTTAIAIELLLLTFVRTGEIRKAKWEEFDLHGALWRIPEGRMKMKSEHIVPLSTQATKLLLELRGITGSSPHSFPNNRRPHDYMTPTTINQALKRLGFSGSGSIGFSAHGFRGTAATLLHELGYQPEIIERQLAHSERSQVKAAYNQAEYLPARTVMMQEWADYIDSIRPN